MGFWHKEELIRKQRADDYGLYGVEGTRPRQESPVVKRGHPFNKEQLWY